MSHGHNSIYKAYSPFHEDSIQSQAVCTMAHLAVCRDQRPLAWTRNNRIPHIRTPRQEPKQRPSGFSNLRSGSFDSAQPRQAPRASAGTWPEKWHGNGFCGVSNQLMRTHIHTYTHLPHIDMYAYIYICKYIPYIYRYMGRWNSCLEKGVLNFCNFSGFLTP